MGWSKPIVGADGRVLGIACGRGRPPGTHKCQVCGVAGDVLCDYPLTAGKTCSVKLCKRCAVRQGKGLDYCPEHHLLAGSRFK